VTLRLKPVVERVDPPRPEPARLPMDDLFLRTELTHAEDHRIVAVEGGLAVCAEEPS